MSRTRAWKGVLAAGLSAVMLVSVSPALAHNPPAGEPRSLSHNLTVPYTGDTELLALSGADFELSPEMAAMLEREQPLADAAAEVRAFANGDGVSGLGGLIADSDLMTLHLYWKGPIPSALRSKVEQIRERHGVTVAIHPAAYTQALLETEARKVMEDTVSSPQNEVVLAGPLPDGSGLRVAVDSGSARPAVSDPPHLASPQDHDLPTSVPIVFEDGPKVELASRESDTLPINGGARITAQGRCSAAFGVWRRDLEESILSAAHCGPYHWYNTAGAYLGPSAIMAPDIDTQVIDAPGRAGMWHGQVTASGAPGPDETILPVSNLHQAVVGLHVHTSGASSGTRLSILVTGTSGIINVGGSLIYEQVTGEQATRGPAVGNGDSGGPVFRYAPNNRVEAAGIITAIDMSTEVPCVGMPTTSTRSCAWRMFFTDLTASLVVTTTSLLVVG
ncbi:hypothetical protein ACWGNE_08350 [Streptomyces xiamenensis]